jgi:predicted GTPase
MFLLGKDIYANFKMEDIPQPKAAKVRSIVMGHCGSGKTSLFNGLCQKNYKT